MRRIVAYQLLSLDGVAEQPSDFVAEFDEVMRENLRRVIAEQDSVLLGRHTFDEWAGLWPTSENEPFAGFINGVEKFVVTSTKPAQSWSNTTVIDSAGAEFVTDLKQRTGGDIGIHGSIALTQSMLELGLVDELRLVVVPALHMHGRRLFDTGIPNRLTLTRHVASPSGSLLLDFRVSTN